MDLEQIIFVIITSSGDAKSYCMEAMAFARNNEFIKAKEYIKKAEKELLKAHEQQTDLIQKEAGGKKTEVSLLMVHAQDHLMNAITVKDLSKEMIHMYEKMYLKDDEYASNANM